MIYTEKTKLAMKICFEAHKNQLDKSGMPYVFHPFHVSEQMKDENTVIVALLHDVAEDTDITFEYLQNMGFSSEIITALKYMTHNDSEPYLDYVRRIKENPIAKEVKLADLKHNSDLTRLDFVDEKAKKRIEKYKKAIKILNGEEE